MSWPQWSTSGIAATGVQASIINPAPNVINPRAVATQYTPDQWAHMQQQNWQQWAQWQQQFQQWQQQYGAEYQKSMTALTQTTGIPPQPTFPYSNVNTNVPPPPPVEAKPPLPPDEPQSQLQPCPLPNSQVPIVNQPFETKNIPPLIQDVRNLNRNRNENYNAMGNQQYGNAQNYPRGPVPARNSKWQHPNNQNQRDAHENRFNPATAHDVEYKGGEAGVKRFHNQTPNVNDAKRTKVEYPKKNENPPLNETPSRQFGNQQREQTIEELTEAENKFDKQFSNWELQFQKWKEQNANHPDKEQYQQYEKKWETWRAQLLERREQMKRKRLALLNAASQSTADKPQSKAEDKPYMEPLEQPPKSYSTASTETFGSQVKNVGKPPDHLGMSASYSSTNLPPPNLNNEPLEFKKSSVDYVEVTQINNKDQGTEAALNAADTGVGFLKSSSSEGIPGLDLVKDKNKLEPDLQAEENNESKNTKPDLEAISRGINSILGNQKLMNMLSLVSQSQSQPVTSDAVNTISSINLNSGQFNREEDNEYFNKDEDFYDNRSQRDEYANVDEQTQSSFSMMNDADTSNKFNPEFENWNNRGPGNFNQPSGNFNRRNEDFDRESRNFNRGPSNNNNRSFDNFNKNFDNSDRNQDRFGRGSDNYGRGSLEDDVDENSFNRRSDNFRPDPDNFSTGPDNYNRGGSNFKRGGDTFSRDEDDFNRDDDSFNRGVGDNFNRGGNNFNRGSIKRGGGNFNRGSDKFNKGSDNFNRVPDNFDVNRGSNSFNRGSDNFDRDPDNFRGSDDFGRGPDNFNRDPDDFGMDSDNFNKDPENLGRGSDNFGRGLDNFNRGHDSFNRGADNFKRGPDNFNRGPDNFNRGPDNFNRGPDSFNRGSGPDNFNHGADNFHRGSNRGPDHTRGSFGDDFNKAPDNFNKGPNDFNAGHDNFNRGLNNFNRKSETFGRGPNNFDLSRGTEDFDKRSKDFVADREPGVLNKTDMGNVNRVSANFDVPDADSDMKFNRSTFNRNTWGATNFDNRSDELQKGLNVERDFDNAVDGFDRFNKMPQQLDNNFRRDRESLNSAPEPMPQNPPYLNKKVPLLTDPKPIDDIWKPANVVDYDHKPLKTVEPDVILELLLTFDYRHKSLNRIPYPQRPKWLSEMLKYYPRLDMTISRNTRLFEPQQLRRYPHEQRFENFPMYENRDRKKYDERDWKSYDDRDRKDKNPFEEKDKREWKYGDIDKNPYDDRDRRSGERDRKTFEDVPYKNEKLESKSLENQKFLSNRKHQKGDDYSDSADSPNIFNENKQYKPYPKRNEEMSNKKNFNVKPNVTPIEDLLSPPGRFNRPPRLVVILRGPPGSGKSFLAKLIKDKEVENGGSAPRILCLDDYFMVEQEKEIEEDGRRVKVKEMVYEYEGEMEESYRQSLMKSFKKTITDGYFNFIVVDNVNDKVKYFGEMWSFAKQNGFQVYICQMELDVQTCTKRNIHNRTEAEIEKCVAGWEQSPSHHPLLDATSLIQSGSIPEVEMEEINSPASETMNEEELMIRSKWDNFDYSIDNLAKLDGINKPLRTSRTMEDYLQLDDEWIQPVSTKPGQKRVRWADLEERKEQEKMRAIGFVVGQTNWNRMMDPTMGSAALTQTKYIERYNRY